MVQFSLTLTLRPEVKALQEKLRDYKFLMKHKIGWKEIKRIIGIRKSNYYCYVSLQQKIGIKGLVVKNQKDQRNLASQFPTANWFKAKE